MKEFCANLGRLIALLVYAVAMAFAWPARWFTRSARTPRTPIARSPAAKKPVDGLLAKLWRRVLQDQVSANALALWLLVGFLSFMFVFKDKLPVWEHILSDPWEKAFATVLFIAIAIMVISAVHNGLVGGVKYSPQWRKRLAWGVPIIFAIAVLALLSVNEKELQGASAAQTTQTTYATPPAADSAPATPATHSGPAQQTTQQSPVVIFLSPVGGESLVHNHVFEFLWDAPSLSKDTLLDLFLVRTDRTQDVYQGLGSVHNSGSYLWYVWDAMEPGPYRLRITRGFDNVLAESETFNIVRE